MKDRMNEWMNERANERMHKWMDEWMDEWMNEWIIGVFSRILQIFSEQFLYRTHISNCF